MKSWQSIHTFDNTEIGWVGKTQIIGLNDDDSVYSKEVDTINLTTFEAFIDDVFLYKPEGNEAIKTEYTVIHLFNNDEVRFYPSDTNIEEFSVHYDLLNKTIINNLVNEITNL